MHRFLLYPFFTITSVLLGQETTMIKGSITTTGFSPIEAHIWNTSQKVGSISTPDGNFEIAASLKDTLRISSLGYKTTFIIVQQQHLEKPIKISLKIAVNELTEVELFQYGLTGNIDSDSKKVTPPVSQLPYFNAAYLEKKKVDRPDDEFSPVWYEPYPDQANLLAIINPLVSLLLKNKNREKEVSLDITTIFDENFIIQTLEVPETRYHDFMDHLKEQTDFETILQSNDELKILEFLLQQKQQFLLEN